MVKVNPVFGIEIELAYNEDYLSIGSKFGEYYTSNFYVTSDCSLESYNINFLGDTAELVSVPFQLDSAKNILNNFRKQVLIDWESNDGFKNPKFKDIFEINDTMGCHIHVTPLDVSKEGSYEVNYNHKRFIFDGVPLNFKGLATEKILNNIDNSVKNTIELKCPNMYNSFRRNYYRDYSDNLGHISRFFERECDFNLTAENIPNPEHFEYRSFNLNGVKNWDDFNNSIIGALRAIKNSLNYDFKRKRIFIENKKFKL